MRIRVPIAIVVAAGMSAVIPTLVLPAHAATTTKIFVLSGEDNRLNVYDATTGAKATLIPSAEDDPKNGLDINAEICTVPDSVPWKTKGELWIIAGEDTEQNTEPGVIKQGWGVFRITGTKLKNLEAEELGKFVPDSFVTQADNPENYGCGVLPDGRVITTDVGDQLPQDPATGQLIEWFPKKSHFTGHLPSGRTDFKRIPHCKIDVGIGTAGGAEVDGTDVLVASNRPNFPSAPGGVYRYDTTVWPTGETAAKGCSREDETGEPLAAADRVGKTLFIPQTPLTLTPSDIVHSGRGTYFISSVFTGQVAEYRKNGLFKRFVVTTTGQVGGITPYGLGVTPDGTLWVADIGILGPGPAAGAGSVVRVRFNDNDQPGQPQTIDEGLEFPDGIGIIQVRIPETSQPNQPDDDDNDDTGDDDASPVGLPATGAPVPWPALGLLTAGLAGLLAPTVMRACTDRRRRRAPAR